MKLTISKYNINTYCCSVSQFIPDSFLTAMKDRAGQCTSSFGDSSEVSLLDNLAFPSASSSNFTGAFLALLVELPMFLCNVFPIK